MNTNIYQQLHHSKILIIDDQESLAQTLKELLEEEDFSHVRFLADSRQAISIYKEFRPDLLILDLHMPHLDGFQIMEKVQELEKDSYIPVLILTGETDVETRYKALQAGAKDFLNKPFNAIETLARIKNLLEVRLLHNDIRNQNTTLEQKVQERTEQLQKAFEDLGQAHRNVKKAYIDTIYHLTRAAEFKDHDTSYHIKRISHYSKILSETLGLNQDETELLFYASPMHDIGKIGIPDRILTKQDALTPAEWEIMKKHTQYGAQILEESNAPILKKGKIIALSHHEHWDGSGYPYGLKGEAIPIEGRIVIVVDVYDALRSNRAYKKALSHKDACQIILQGDDRLKPEFFDPNILAAFKKIHSKMERVFDENQD